MRKITAILVVLILLFCGSAFAKSKVKVKTKIGKHTLSSSGSYLGARGFGIGIVLGVINGLSVKTWVNEDHALQFDATWNFSYGSIGVGAAYLIHNLVAFEIEDNKFPVYFGIKGWAAFAANAAVVGIQVPVGIAWIPRTAPIDVFFQIEPGISLIPAVGSAMGGGVGIRYWFD